jgi:hypothetical protein
MLQFSRAIYRALAPGIDVSINPEAHRLVIDACERSVQRLATDRRYFARPARTLFQDVRPFFPVQDQARVLRVVESYMTVADDWLSRRPPSKLDALGNRLQCQASTRRGTPCRRAPLPTNGYCPSHQHLAETEKTEALAA